MAYGERNRATSIRGRARTCWRRSVRGIEDVPSVHRSRRAPQASDHPQRGRGALDDGMGFDGSSSRLNAIEELTWSHPRSRDLRCYRRPARMIWTSSPDGEPYAGDPACAQRAQRWWRRWASHVQCRPRGGVLPSDEKGTESSTRGSSRRRPSTRDRRPPRHDPRARVDGHPGQYHHPRFDRRSNEIDIRYLARSTWPTTCSRTGSSSRRSRSNGYTTFMPKPLFGETARACTRTCRLHPGHTFFAGTTVAPLRRRQGVHRRPAPPRARASAVFAVGQFRKRLVPGEAPVTSPGRSGIARP
jgi:hypothetical protein